MSGDEINPYLLTTATSVDEAERAATVAVLPIGSFEQHGGHLPLITDTVVACLIASRIAEDYGLFLLPPITIGCSHEHAAFAGTVSISSITLHRIVDDVATSLAAKGIEKLVLVNGHGGNYVLSNIVQEANAHGRRMLLYPGREAWDEARRAAGCATDAHSDMHGGELETSLLLHATPPMVREGWQAADWQAPDRRDFLLVGTVGYAANGIIGSPSLASADKGATLVRSLSESFKAHLHLLVS